MFETPFIHLARIRSSGRTLGVSARAHRSLREAEWHAAVDANLTATFLTIKSFLPIQVDAQCGMSRRTVRIRLPPRSSASRPRRRFNLRPLIGGYTGPSHDQRASGNPAGTSSGERGYAAIAAVAHRKYAFNVARSAASSGSFASS